MSSHRTPWTDLEVVPELVVAGLEAEVPDDEPGLLLLCQLGVQALLAVVGLVGFIVLFVVPLLVAVPLLAGRGQGQLGQLAVGLDL